MAWSFANSRGSLQCSKLNFPLTAVLGMTEGISVLKSLPEVKHVPVHVVAQPDLLPLIHSSPGKEENRNATKKLPRHGFYRSRPRSKEKQRAVNLSHRRQN